MYSSRSGKEKRREESAGKKDGTRANEPWSEQKKINATTTKYSKQKLLNTQRMNTWQLKHYPFAFDTHDDPAISRGEQRSLSARADILNTWKHACTPSLHVVLYFVFCSVWLLLPLPLLPFILTSFVDSIETWYITRRASLCADILSIQK